jgi:hypothetical protein
LNRPKSLFLHTHNTAHRTPLVPLLRILLLTYGPSPRTTSSKGAPCAHSPAHCGSKWPATKGTQVVPALAIKATLLAAGIILKFAIAAPATADPDPLPQPAPPTPVPPTTVAATTQPARPTFPTDAWSHFTSLLNSRGLSIDPSEQAFDDRANRHLCLLLFSNNDPTYRANTIQSAIQESEGGPWGPAEATYATHAAIQAYCPQFDNQ